MNKITVSAKTVEDAVKASEEGKPKAYRRGSRKAARYSHDTRSDTRGH